MASKDIEKLKEKVEKDPNSKLFVPLAEEYRKEGMIDEAVQVLLDGIGRQPTYMSARVSLGKMYLEKGMLKEARAEFESVIKSIPDNLFAHKKLAEIYRGTGERVLALKAYKTVLRLNAMDEEASASLRDLENAESIREPAAPIPAERESPVEEVLLLEADVHEAASEEKAHPAVYGELSESGSIQSVGELNAFKKSLFANKTAMDALPSGIAEESEVLELVDGQEEEMVEDMSFGDIEESAISDETVIDGAMELKSKKVAGETIPEKPSVAGPSLEPQDKTATIENAGRQIAEGNFNAAMDMYRRILLTDPGNRKALQRAEELRALLKLMGKDKEALVSRLNVFLEEIRKRRDEFFGSA